MARQPIIQSNNDAEVPAQPHFKQQIRFVFAQDKDSGKKVQEHIQREYARKKRWSKKVKQAQEAKEAGKSFRQFVVRTKTDTTALGETSGNDRAFDRQIIKDEGGGIELEEVEEIIRDGLRMENGVDLMDPVESYDEFVLTERSIPDPISLLGAGRANPFGTWPVAEKGLDGFIDSFLCLDYRIFGLPSNSKFHPVRDFAFQIAIQGAAPMHAIAAYGAMWIAPVQNPGREALSLKAKALQMVNQSLVKVDEPLIYAVSILWMLEARYGTPEARQWHAKAVQRMIMSQGGYEVLGFRLQLQIAWCMITLPDALNFGSLPDDMFLHAYFTQLIGFAECVDILASSRRSPYPSEAMEFAKRAHLYNLLSGRVESQSAFKAVPRLYGLCRLTVLLYIHAVFLDFHQSPEMLRAELQKLRHNASTIQALERHITLESLALMIFKDGDREAMENSERTVVVLRMMTIVKKMSTTSLEKMLSLFLGYLTGRRYNQIERQLYWNVDEMEDEAFGISMS